MHNNKKMIGLAILMLSLVLLVGCNQELGDLTIEVKDNNDQPLNTEVKVTRDDKTRTKETNNGLAQFNDIPTGTYQVEVTKDGYYSVSESVTLQDQSLTYEINLERKKFGLRVNVTNQAGEKLTATAQLEGANMSKTIRVTEGTIQLSDLVPGEYQLTVSKDGYQTVAKTLTINKEDLSTTLKLAKSKPDQNTEEKEEKKEKEKVTTKNFNLNVNVVDINNNQLAAKVKVKQNDSIVAKDTAAQAKFNNLKAGNYTIDISKENYQTWSQEVNLSKTDKTITAALKGGSIKQYWIDSKDGKQKITVDPLADNEELIVALAGLNWNNINQKNIYPVRQKANQLIKEHGLNFANKNRNYKVGDTKQFKIPSEVSNKGTITAELAKTGENIYLFVAEDSYLKDQDLEKLVTEFDNNIYPAITNKENINGKITVLLNQFSDYQMTGYFDPADLYPNLGNEEPMFYVNARRNGNTNTLLTSAAHQYQHLNFFVDKAKAGRIANDAWIDQGIAQLSPQLLGYIGPDKEGWSPENGNGWVYNQDFGYLNNTAKVNLLVHDGSLPFTGAAGLFTNYLVDTYGPKLIYNIITSPKEPQQVIADYTGTSFNKIYLNWITTNVTDSIEKINNPIYNYTTFDLAQLPKFNKEASTKGVSYFKVNKNEFTIDPPEGFEGKLGIVIIRQQK